MQQKRNVHQLATLAQFQKWQYFWYNPTLCALELVYENLGVTLYFFGLMLRFLLCCLPQLYILELPSALVRKQRCYYFDGGEAERGS